MLVCMVKTTIIIQVERIIADPYMTILTLPSPSLIPKR